MSSYRPGRASSVICNTPTSSSSRGVSLIYDQARAQTAALYQAPSNRSEAQKMKTLMDLSIRNSKKQNAARYTEMTNSTAVSPRSISYAHALKTTPMHGSQNMRLRQADGMTHE